MANDATERRRAPGWRPGLEDRVAREVLSGVACEPASGVTALGVRLVRFLIGCATCSGWRADATNIRILIEGAHLGQIAEGA